MIEPPFIQISPNPEITMHDIGDGQRYAIVDNFLADPHALIAYVVANAGMMVSSPMGHPGRGPDIGEAVTQQAHGFIRSSLSRYFPFHRGGITLTSFLSNVALKPEELSVFHRMCHIDPRRSPDQGIFAGVVYLFANPELGGTAFYRWKAKDVAVRAYQLASRDSVAALRYLEEHSDVYRKPPEYMTSSNDIAELVAIVPARFNRLVFYNGEIPHSGHITRPDLLSSDATRGRLALNLFAHVRPRDSA